MATTTRMICIIGPDGCGKSTQVNRLITRLKSEGVNTKYVWLRFFHFFSIPILIIGRILNYTEIRKCSDGTTIGIHNYSKSKLLSSIYVMTTIIDMFLAVFIKISIPRILIKKTIVCDRFTYDTLVDLMVSTANYNLFKGHAGRMLHRLVPQDAKVITLMADTSVIMQRRPDILHDPNYALRVRLYSKTCEYFGLQIVDTILSEEEVERIILERIKNESNL